jgi:hypothetical protein
VEQTVAGRGIGVQLIGDDNTVIVYAGLAELKLIRKHARKAEPKTELQLFGSISARLAWSGEMPTSQPWRSGLRLTRPDRCGAPPAEPGQERPGSASNYANARINLAGPPGSRSTANSRSS